MASSYNKHSHSSDALLQNLSDGAERMAKICDDVWNLNKDRSDILSAIEEKMSGNAGSRRNSFRGDIGELATLVQAKLDPSSQPPPTSPDILFGQDPKAVREFFTRLITFEGFLIYMLIRLFLKLPPVIILQQPLVKNDTIQMVQDAMQKIEYKLSGAA